VGDGRRVVLVNPVVYRISTFSRPAVVGAGVSSVSLSAPAGMKAHRTHSPVRLSAQRRSLPTSQALFERAADGRHSALSAGTTPGDHVHPEVAEVMREPGIDLAGRKPQPPTRELAERADIVIAVGCGDQCPYISGKR
jgi:hypothetical protein